MHGQDPQQAEAEGHQQQHQPGHGVEPVQSAFEEGQALMPVQSGHPQGPLREPQGLKGSGGPALPLPHEIVHALGGQAGTELFA